ADMAGLPDLALVALATDGGDGPTDAAGAVVTGATLDRARALGLDPAAHLARNDAYPFLDALGDLLKPGPTETNVNDLAFVFAFSPPRSEYGTMMSPSKSACEGETPCDILGSS